MTVQAVVLLIYALPMLLAPRSWTVLTRQSPLPENYILRAVGIALLIVSYLELKIVSDLERYQGLILAYAYLPGLFCLTIIVQVLKRRLDGKPAFYGASGYWWLNGVVTAVFAIAVYMASPRL
jgi:uncharacterized membrane protein YdcZ (DUF606 family)